MKAGLRKSLLLLCSCSLFTASLNTTYAHNHRNKPCCNDHQHECVPSNVKETQWEGVFKYESANNESKELTRNEILHLGFGGGVQSKVRRFGQKFFNTNKFHPFSSWTSEIRDGNNATLSKEEGSVKVEAGKINVNNSKVDGLIVKLYKSSPQEANNTNGPLKMTLFIPKSEVSKEFFVAHPNRSSNGGAYFILHSQDKMNSKKPVELSIKKTSLLRPGLNRQEIKDLKQ